MINRLTKGKYYIIYITVKENIIIEVIIYLLINKVF